MEVVKVELIRISDVQKTYKTGTVALYDMILILVLKKANLYL